MIYFIGYLILINVISAIVCAVDKRKAIKGKRRISEKCLFILCFLGGGPFMYVTMRAIRHKTLHKRFMIGIPLIVLIQLFCVFMLINY